MSAVLITGARAPVALDLARAFANAGREVHLADSIAPWAARFVRPRRPLHLLPPPRFAFAHFSEALARLVDELKLALIIPTCEEVYYIAAAAERRGFADLVFAPSPAALRQFHSKVAFAQLVGEAGARAPHTQRITSRAELARVEARSSELVFKPEFSRFASHTLVRPTRAALRKITPTPAQPWAVQDFIAGEEICIWSAARAGDLIAFAAYRPRWRLGRSASFYFETDRDPALLAFAAKIAAVTRVTGQLSFDVIRSADGAIAPIECNPRSVSGVHLFDGAPGLAEALLGGRPLLSPAADARHLTLAMWMLGAPQALTRGAFSAFRADLARSKDVMAANGGAALALGATMDATRFALVGLSRGRSAAGQSTDDIEWNGEPIA